MSALFELGSVCGLLATVSFCLVAVSGEMSEGETMTLGDCWRSGVFFLFVAALVGAVGLIYCATW